MKKPKSSVTVLLIVLVACSREAGGESGIVDNPDAAEENVVIALELPTPTIADDSNSHIAEDPTVTIVANGSVISAWPEFEMAFETSGRLLAVHVHVGDFVIAGTLLATLDDANVTDRITEAELNLESTELSLASLAGTDLVADANLESAEASLASTRARLDLLLLGADEDSIELARLNLEQTRNNLLNAERERDASMIQSDTQYAQKRMEIAVDNAEIAVQIAEINYRQVRNDATAEEVAAAKASVLAARAQVVGARAGIGRSEESPSAETREVAVAKIEVARARIALDNARDSLEQLRVYAPSPAVVTEVHAAAGRSVAAGLPIVTLYDHSLLEFHTTNVTEREIANIVPGLGAVITLKSYPDLPIDGTVSRVGMRPGTPIGDSATFPVVIGFDTKGFDLRPGMTGRAEIFISP